MIYLKNDKVKLISGEIGEIIETWGVARNWCKILTASGEKIITMTSNIDSLIFRPTGKRKWR